MKIFLPLLILAISFFVGCDSPEELPSFVRIEKFVLTDNPLLEEGSLSENIEYAHVYIGTEDLGIVQLPVTIPVLANGENNVKIDPVVKTNGISATLGIYPFYKRYRTTINLTKSKTDTLFPITSYIDEAVIHFVEDFENVNHAFVEKIIPNQPIINQTSSDSFEGKSGVIGFSKENFKGGYLTSKENLIPLAGGKKIWAEINYKTTSSILLGIIGYDGADVEERISFGLNANSEWNKVYFDFTDDIIVTNSADGYQFVIQTGMPIDNAGNFSADTATVLLDNIKLISF